jgi:hypothetical protein
MASFLGIGCSFFAPRLSDKSSGKEKNPNPLQLFV